MKLCRKMNNANSLTPDEEAELEYCQPRLANDQINRKKNRFQPTGEIETRDEITKWNVKVEGSKVTIDKRLEARVTRHRSNSCATKRKLPQTLICR